jgi:glyoxylase-like metal-dependent hydrolase (beta-lactamase superfamily II)
METVMNHLSRRSLLAASSAALALGVTRGALAKAPMLGTQAPAFYRFRIGAIEATVISDGPLGLGPVKAEMFGGYTQEQIDQLFAKDFLSTEAFKAEQNALVLNTGDKLALLDTGMGGSKAFGPSSGQLLANMKAAGIDPKDIDAVLLTHAHPDHCWGVMGESAPNFPNAQIYITQADLEFWTDEDKSAHQLIGQLIAPTRKALLPVRDRIVFIKDGQEVLPGVHVVATPGHTVGHVSYMIASEGKQLFNSGDIVHHHLLTLRNPKVKFVFDTDAEQSAASRIRAFEMLATDRTPLIAYHFPWPGVGHIAKDGDGYRYVPMTMQMVL